MAAIGFERVSKVFPDGTVAVDDVDLTIPDGDFTVLVGPSGSGKSTALRMVAGLEDVTHGTIRLGVRLVRRCKGIGRDGRLDRRRGNRNGDRPGRHCARVGRRSEWIVRGRLLERIGLRPRTGRMRKRQHGASDQEAADIRGGRLAHGVFPRVPNHAGRIGNP